MFGSKKVPEEKKPKDLVLVPTSHKSEPRPSIECPRCKFVSFSLDDIKEKYCGNCHKFHDEIDHIQEVKTLLRSLTYGDKMAVCDKLSDILEKKLSADEIAACLHKFSKT